MESKPSTPKSLFDVSMDDATDSLESMEHYGVLGMKWGVRKDDRGRKGGATKGQIANKKRKTNIRTETYIMSDGSRREITYDSSKVKVTQTKKGVSISGSRRDVKKVQQAFNASGKKPSVQTSSEKVNSNKLSDKELLDRINRVKLEQEYSRLHTPAQTTGQKFKERITSDLINSGSQVLVKSIAVPLAMKGINSMMGTNFKTPDINLNSGDNKNKKDKKKDAENSSFLSALESADAFDKKVAEQVKKVEKTPTAKLPDLGSRHDKNDTAKHGTKSPSFFDFLNTFKKDNKLSSDEVDTSDVYVDYLEKYGFEDVPYVDLDEHLTFKP